MHKKNLRMKHHILRTLFCMLFAAAPFAVMAAADAPNEPIAPAVSEGITDEPGEISVEVRGNVIHVRNAQGATLEIYDITGKRVSATRIDSNDKKISLSLGKGCYIVRVGKITRKIALS